jgi:isopentenyl-diphosphate delta-isomerase
MIRNLTDKRKMDHIQISLNKDVSSSLMSGLEKYHFVHQALPEIDLDQIDSSQKFLGKEISFPLLISPMTGGTKRAAKINANLASAAEEKKIVLALGSQRAAIEDPALVKTYQMRKFAPEIPILANMGAIQLNYGFTLDQCKQAVDVVHADGLVLHLNPLQESLQPEGNTNFSNLIRKIESICRKLECPVIVKEVGFGISERVAKMLAESGVWGIDVAGGGGTSWAQVEKYRARNAPDRMVAEAFRDWGISTADSIIMVRKAAPRLKIIASGGLRSGVDLAKCIALGADLCGIALPFLRAANFSRQSVENLISIYQKQLRISMFAVGAANIKKLSQIKLIYRE